MRASYIGTVAMVSIVSQHTDIPPYWLHEPEFALSDTEPGTGPGYPYIYIVGHTVALIIAQYLPYQFCYVPTYWWHDPSIDCEIVVGS